MDLISVYAQGATLALKLHAQRVIEFSLQGPEMDKKLDASLKALLPRRYQTEVVGPLQDLVMSGAHDETLKLWLNTECNFVAMLVLMDVGVIPKNAEYAKAYATPQAG